MKANEKRSVRPYLVCRSTSRQTMPRLFPFTTTVCLHQCQNCLIVRLNGSELGTQEALPGRCRTLDSVGTPYSSRLLTCGGKADDAANTGVQGRLRFYRMPAQVSARDTGWETLGRAPLKTFGTIGDVCYRPC